MIISIDNFKFQNLIAEEFLELPQRWDGKDFYKTVNDLFDEYINILTKHISKRDVNIVRTICNNLLKCIDNYHKGFPNAAFDKMSDVMKKLNADPLKIYAKSGYSNEFDIIDRLKLFRARNVQQNINYERKDIFHTPYNLRSKVATCRYSISGFPSLYLGTSLELCCEESKISSFNDLTIASLFKLQRNMFNNDNLMINVIELGIKPSDFIPRDDSYDQILAGKERRRLLDEISLDDPIIMGKYLYWYPLIAACSFIRVNKSDQFASEYIIPQLLMQWVRSQVDENKLVGIRYFSCASNRASELGFNYIFPVSGKDGVDKPYYCNVLRRAFKLTKPKYIHEYESVRDCENAMKKDNNYNEI